MLYYMYVSVLISSLTGTYILVVRCVCMRVVARQGSRRIVVHGFDPADPLCGSGGSAG